eukprot:3694523-Pyramimonas_sp.AAC.2
MGSLFAPSRSAQWPRSALSWGCAPSLGPELRRRGWAVVELLDCGLPVRVVFGALPGRQSVPGAERYAGALACKVAPPNSGTCGWIA